MCKKTGYIELYTKYRIFSSFISILLNCRNKVVTFHSNIFYFNFLREVIESQKLQQKNSRLGFIKVLKYLEDRLSIM